MTVAVCIRCGATKHGALTPCLECQFDPQANEDKAKAMILTNHFLSEADLTGISDRIRSKQPVNYPQEVLDDYVKMFEDNPNLGKFPIFAKIGCGLIVVAVFAFLVWFLLKST